MNSVRPITRLPDPNALAFLEGVDAGHGHPFPRLDAPDDDALRGDAVHLDGSALGGSGVALGVMEDSIFEEYTKTGLRQGQIIFLSTDGIWEACNEEGEMLGKAPILETIRQNADSDAALIIDAVIDMLEQYTAGAKIEDDITAVIVKIQDDHVA